jgi:hypothetical protein
MKMIRTILFSLGLIIALNSNANGDNKQTTTTKIIVKDAVTQEALVGVAIKLDNRKETIYTDLNGEISLNTIKGLKYDLSVDYIGYTSEVLRLEGGIQNLTIQLKP